MTFYQTHSATDLALEDSGHRNLPRRHCVRPPNCSYSPDQAHVLVFRLSPVPGAQQLSRYQPQLPRCP